MRLRIPHHRHRTLRTSLLPPIPSPIHPNPRLFHTSMSPPTPLFRLSTNPTHSAPLPILHGFIFDLDGTLTLPPPSWFFPSLRAASGAPPGVDILRYISTLPPSAQSAANARLESIERRAMSSMQPQPGLPSLLAWCEANNIRTGVVTRNFDEPVSHLVTMHLTSRDPETGREKSHEFMPVLTREFREVKPSPGPLLECVRVWGTECGNVLMVGDSKDDVEAARRAGVGCVVVRNEGNGGVAEMEGVVGVVERLEDLRRFVVGGMDE